MALNIILGAAGSGKTTRCFDIISDRLKEKSEEKIFMIVPEQMTFERERFLINKLGESALFNATVINFTRLCHRVFKRLGGNNFESLDESGKAMILYYILNSNDLELKAFAAVTHQKGFATLVSDMISDFKKHNINYTDLEAIYDDLENKENSNLEKKIFDLKEIYKRFEGEIQGRFLDSDDNLKRLLESIDEYDETRDSEIFIDEFASFSSQQLSLIGKFLLISKDVYVTLNHKKGDNQNTFKTVNDSFDVLRKIATDNNIDVNVIDLGDKSHKFNSLELEVLEDGIGNISCKEFKDETKNIEIDISFNNFKEIEFIARDIKRSVREENLMYKDIAIITREIEDYKEFLKAVFKEQSIPYFLDATRETNSNNFIVFAFAALDLINKNWSYEGIFTYLKTYMIDVDMEDIDLLENYVLSHGIRGKTKWVDKHWEFPVYDEYNPYESEDEFLDKVNSIRLKIVEPLRELLEINKRKDSIKNMATIFYKFLQKSGVCDQISNMVKKFAIEGDLAIAEEYSQIFDKVMEVLSSLVDVLGDKEVSLSEFIKIFTVGIDKVDVGIIPTALDEVFIGGAARAKNYNIKKLYVMGCNDGVFPMTSSNEGLLSDFELELLKEGGLEINIDSNTLAFKEEYLVYSVLTMPTDSLVLSYCVGDLNGKAKRPSSIINKVRKIFPRVKINNFVLEDNLLNRLSSANVSFNDFILGIKDNKDYEKEILADMYKWYLENEDYREKLDNVKKYYLYDNNTVKLSKESIEKIYGSKIHSSVTQLERYAACPFQYYATYGLKARERKTSEITFPSIGSLLHEGIDLFCHMVVSEGLEFKDVTKEYIEEKLVKIIDQLLDKKQNYIFLTTARLKFLVRRLKRVLKRTLLLLVYQLSNTEFVPKGFEYSFKEGEDADPIVINQDGKSIYIVGTVDRVDVYKDGDRLYVRIIDYKLGEVKIDFSKIYNGLQLQLLTYIKAIMENEKKQGNNPVPSGVFYYKMDEPFLEGRNNLSEEEKEEKIREQLKLQGILLKDKEVILAMDNTLEDGNSSLIVNATINKNGDLKKGTKGQVEEDEFAYLCNFAMEKLSDLCKDVLDGEIEVAPYKLSDKTPCEYCNFKSICHFDNSLEFNKFRDLQCKKSVKEMRGENDE